METIQWFLDNLKATIFRARGRRPGDHGCVAYSRLQMNKLLSQEGTIDFFVPPQPLPRGYGIALSERAIEYPWLLARLQPHECKILDAGSALNHRDVICHKRFLGRKLTCVTLAPETECYYHQGVAYLFEDLRSLPLKDDSYDAVVCISTLEHIGMDNFRYTGTPSQTSATLSFLDAVREFNRVLKTGGRLYVTLPYGRYQDKGWLQQFDASLLSRLGDAFQGNLLEVSYYRYTDSGWDLSDAEQCMDAEYKASEMATAVACLVLEKT